MIKLLSCGPIIEPIIGISISVIICGFLLFYTFKRTKENVFYKNDFKQLSNLKKSIYSILYLTIVICCLWLTFFILAMIFSTILLMF
ncbi:hypothetical protein HNQ02_002869 [Flavobacterium sp. 7E]|nr:hypothetical protein [Flavobacterium sp. PL002]NRS89934.1 hypothetical protein [Flavobacterium sp. 7E]